MDRTKSHCCDSHSSRCCETNGKLRVLPISWTKNRRRRERERESVIVVNIRGENRPIAMTVFGTVGNSWRDLGKRRVCRWLWRISGSSYKEPTRETCLFFFFRLGIELARTRRETRARFFVKHRINSYGAIDFAESKTLDENGRSISFMTDDMNMKIFPGNRGESTTKSIICIYTILKVHNIILLHYVDGFYMYNFWLYVQK